MAKNNTPEHHPHTHAQNRFGVIPTPLRMNARPEFTGKGVTIAFLDSGFYAHPDLTEPENRILAFEDISRRRATLNANRAPKPWDWHGTQTSVVAAGNGYLSDGIYRGIAADAQVVLVKVGAEGKITEEHIARGLEWVISNKDRYDIRIVNISLGGDQEISFQESIVDQAAEEAVRLGIVVVAAA
ncbi:MAG TPA: S8 family serine peptidase, partial [Blastocatellia bacterium]|nr:S8 family serine peptidase [Blastocatellia bacterium]